MRDPYDVLGVAKTATPEEIRKAYRQLAKKLHPDLNPGDKRAEEQFKEGSAANDILSDPDKRKRYDAGEIDASGAEKAPPQGRYYREYAGGEAGHPYESASGYADFAEGDDLFAELMRRSREQARRAPGDDLHYELHVPFLDAVNGASKTITLPQGGTLEVSIRKGSRTEIYACGARARPRAAKVRRATRWCRSPSNLTAISPARATTSISSCRSPSRRPRWRGGARADHNRQRDAKDSEGIQHRRHAAAEGQGREAAPPAGDEFVKLKVVMPMARTRSSRRSARNGRPPTNTIPARRCEP